MVYFQIFPKCPLPDASNPTPTHSQLNKADLQGRAVLGYCGGPAQKTAKSGSNFRFTTFCVIWGKLIQLSVPQFSHLQNYRVRFNDLLRICNDFFFKRKRYEILKNVFKSYRSDGRRRKRWQRRKEEEETSRKWLNFPPCKHCCPNDGWSTLRGEHLPMRSLQTYKRRAA